MKHFFSLFLLLFFSLVIFSFTQQQIKVACVGDSITEGDGLQDKAKEAYPAILSTLLGNEYNVVNFGASGATLLKSGDWPYWSKPVFREALDFNPDIVIIKLGSNDAKPQNIPMHSGEYINDLRAMVDSFMSLPSRPDIYLCKPTPAFPNRFHIIDSLLCCEVLPAIDLVAAEKGCTIIDLHAGLSDREMCFPDGVHPDKEAVVVMAGIIAGQISKH